MRFGLLLLLLLAAATPAAAQNYDIIVAPGQSNNTQVGYGPYYDPLQTAAIDGRIKTLTRFGSDLFKVIPAFNSDGSEHLENWNNYSPVSKKHAFIISFARRYVKNRLAVGRDVLILPAARGGSSILDWNNKLFAYPESWLLFSDMMGKLGWLLSIPGNRLVSINISQGETDVGFYERGGGQGMTPGKYGEELGLLLQRMTTAFPGVPIITTKFAPQWRKGQAIKAQMEAAIKTTTESFGGKTVETTGLLSNTGAVNDPHFNAQSMQQLGARHWMAYAILRP